MVARGELRWRAGGTMLDSEQAIAKVDRLVRVGEKLLVQVDYDLYDRWNDSALKVLELIFGQPSEPYMSFRFPGGAEAADSRESRVKNAIAQKLKVLGFVQQDMGDESLKPKFGWMRSDAEIEKELAGLETA
jgi:hypothetical protein